MDFIPLHPKIVHLPIALAVLMPLVSAGVLMAWWKQWLPRRAWVLALSLQAALVVSGFIGLRTGEHDEERVERIVAEQHIEAHEEAAEAFVVVSAVVLGLMVLAGLLRPEKFAHGAAAVAAVGTLVVLLLGYRVGDAGGRLVYQHGAAAAYTGAAPGAGTPQPPRSGHADRDDD